MRYILIFLLALGLNSAVLGDTMECGGGILDTAEVDPPNQADVRRKCGEPDEQYNNGYQWVYRKSQWVYVLQFNNHGELITIQRNSTQE
jgi:hypothetical protein